MKRATAAFVPLAVAASQAAAQHSVGGTITIVIPSYLSVGPVDRPPLAPEARRSGPHADETPTADDLPVIAARGNVPYTISASYAASPNVASRTLPRRPADVEVRLASSVEPRARKSRDADEPTAVVTYTITTR